jgi:hypothetical protein
MKYFWIKSILIATMLSAYSFGYPVNFEVDEFNRLKLALLKVTNQAATLNDAAQTPFYIIVLTRGGKSPLSELDSGATTSKSSEIHRIISELFNTPNTLPTQASRTEGEIPQYLDRSLGIVVFNEYFFSGQTPMDSSLEADLGHQFSDISPRYIFAINSLTLSQGGHFQEANSVPIEPQGKASLHPVNLIGLATNPKYPNLLTEIQSGQPQSDPLVETREQVPSGSSQNQIRRGQAITNRTVFWNNQVPVAQYCKNTYALESGTEIRKGASYFIGYQTIMAPP